MKEKDRKFWRCLVNANMLEEYADVAAPVLRVLYDNRTNRGFNVAEIARELGLFNQDSASFDEIDAICFGVGYLKRQDFIYTDGYDTRYHLSGKGSIILPFDK